MTKEQVLNIEGLSAKQVASAKRYFWRAEKAGKPCVFDDMQTAEEVVAHINKGLRNSTDETAAAPAPRAFSLESLTIAELTELLEKIPGIIEAKKQAQIADIDAQIAQLKEMKKELSK